MNKHNCRFVTIFPATENVHLVKDVGMIPYILYKYCGYESTIASFKNGTYEYLNSEVLGLRQVFISRITNWVFLDVLIFIIFNFRKYDIMQFYHYKTSNILWAIVFKIIKFGKGKTYLKLDANDSIKELSFSSYKMKILKRLMATIDLISVETNEMAQWLTQNWNIPVKHIPNGFYDHDARFYTDYINKENYIITVGRIGSKPKSSETLCEAFKSIADLRNAWKVLMVGPIEDNFKIYIENFFIENPDLTEKIIFTGAITNRQELAALYRKSKVFVLTSKWEGFALVYLEAMRAGCYIISSNLTSAREVTDNGKHGKLFPVGDVNALSDILLDITHNENIMLDSNKKNQDRAYNIFYWPKICKDIDSYLSMK